MKSFVFLLLACTAANLPGQFQGHISTISPLDAPQNHYATLQQLNAEPRPGVPLDTLVYPPESYHNGTLLFALAKPHYLTSEQVDFLVGEVHFPANSSAQTRAELDFLLDLQHKRTDAQTERVLEIGKIGYWPDANYLPTHRSYQKNLEHLFFECREVLGDTCTAEKYPATTDLLRGIMNDMRVMEFAVKYRLLRARPYQLEPRLEPLKKIGSPSFASGHTLWAYLQAFTLAELLPEHRTAFLDLAYEIGFSREIMGVHYPSDEEAARQLAHRMLWLMWHTERFQQDFRTARAEWQ